MTQPGSGAPPRRQPGASDTRSPDAPRAGEWWAIAPGRGPPGSVVPDHHHSSGRSGRAVPLVQAALPHPDAVRHVVEQPRGDIADRVHRRPALAPVKDGWRERQGSERKPQPRDGQRRGQRYRPPGARERTAEQPACRDGPGSGEPARQRPGIVGERGEPPGEQPGGRTDDGRARDRASRHDGEPGCGAPSRHRDRGHRTGMAQLQRRGGGAVVPAPGEPFTQVHPVLVRPRSRLGS